MDKVAINILLFIFVINFLVFKADGSYYVTEKSSSWIVNDNICTVAVPPISYSSGGIYVDIDQLEVNDMILSERGVWVGYYEIPKAFDYINCVPLQTSEEISVKKITEPSPGRCYSACAHGRFFGIFNNQCYCLKTNFDRKTLRPSDRICTLECANQAGLACGGSRGNDSVNISVYKYNPYAEQGNECQDGNTYCLKVKPKVRDYQWSNCSDQVEELCDYGDKYLATSSPAKNNSWLDNSNVCIKNGGMAVAFEDDINVKLEKYEQLWTNTIRSSVIMSIKTDGIEPINFRSNFGVGYGFIQKRNGRVQLYFSRRPDDGKYILCTKESGDGTDSTSQWCIPVAIVTTTLLVIFITLSVIKRRKKFKRIQRAYSFLHERRQETVSDAPVNIEESPNVNHCILVQRPDLVAEHSDNCENANCNTAIVSKNNSRDESDDVHNKMKHENSLSDELTVTTRNKKKIYLSDCKYNQSQSKNNVDKQIGENNQSSALGNELTSSIRYVEIISSGDVYDSVEIKTKMVRDTFQNQIDDGTSIAINYELSPLNNNHGNALKYDTEDDKNTTDRNLQTIDTVETKICIDGNQPQTIKCDDAELERHNARESSLLSDDEYVAIKVEMPLLNESFPYGDTVNSEMSINENYERNDDIYDAVGHDWHKVDNIAENQHILDEYVTLKCEVPTSNNIYVNGVQDHNALDIDIAADGYLQENEIYDDFKNKGHHVPGGFEKSLYDDTYDNVMPISSKSLQSGDTVDFKMSIDGNSEKIDDNCGGAENEMHKIDNIADKQNIVDEHVILKFGMSMLNDDYVIDVQDCNDFDIDMPSDGCLRKSEIIDDLQNVKYHVPGEVEMSGLDSKSENVTGELNDEEMSLQRIKSGACNEHEVFVPNNVTDNTEEFEMPTIVDQSERMKIVKREEFEMFALVNELDSDKCCVLEEMEMTIDGNLLCNHSLSEEELDEDKYMELGKAVHSLKDKCETIESDDIVVSEPLLYGNKADEDIYDYVEFKIHNECDDNVQHEKFDEYDYSRDDDNNDDGGGK